MSAVAAKQASEPRLRGQPRAGGVVHVVVAQLAVQPIGQGQVAVVRREHQVGDQPGHAARQGPAIERLVGDVDHLLGVSRAGRGNQSSQIQLTL